MTMSVVNRIGTKDNYEVELKSIDSSCLPKEVISKVSVFLRYEQLWKSMS